MASRKRRKPAGAPRKPRPDADARHGPSETQPRLRGEARNEQIRAGIDPLGPDETPTPLVVAIYVAVLLAIANVVLLIVGYDLPGRAQSSTAGGLGVVVVLLVAAVGMWARRYWAVLGFQTLLGLTCAYAGLSLLVASNVTAALLCIVIAGAAGTLFYRLVRVMARMQAPQRPGKS